MELLLPPPIIQNIVMLDNPTATTTSFISNRRRQHPSWRLTTLSIRQVGPDIASQTNGSSGFYWVTNKQNFQVALASSSF